MEQRQYRRLVTLLRDSVASAAGGAAAPAAALAARLPPLM